MPRGGSRRFDYPVCHPKYQLLSADRSAVESFPAVVLSKLDVDGRCTCDCGRGDDGTGKIQPFVRANEICYTFSMHKASWMSWLAVVTYISLACSGCSGDGNAETGGTSSGGTDGGTGGGTDGGTNGGTGGGTDGGSDMCGDVVAAAHPPFKAIERLATTSDEVRILVYGQSISEQTWWSKTKTWLQQQYPSSKLVMEEHARGGCASQCLIGHAPWSDGKQYNRLVEDVFEWKPDLVIFHVYGDHVDYGYIMKALTQGCAAFDDYRTWDGKDVPAVHCTPDQKNRSSGYTPPEVLVQSDHRWAGNYPKTCPANAGPENWDCFMNVTVVPGHVKERGYILQDNWNLWAQAIESEKIDPLTLTNGPDDVHLSELGNEMMFRMTAPHLCYKP